MLKGPILACGSVNADILGVVDEFCLPGGAAIADHGCFALGGHAANFAVTAARLGAPVELSAAIGDDPNGVWAADILDRAGVGLDAVTRSATHTGVVFVPVHRSSGERGLYLIRGANADWQPPEEAVAARCPLAVVFDPPVHATAYFADKFPGRWIFSPGSLAEYVDLSAHLPVIRTCALLVVNAFEADLLGAGSKPEAAAGVLHDMLGVPAVVTAGADGSWLADGEGVVHHQPAFAVDEVVDTTGAGDSYLAGLAWALTNGVPVRPAMRRASAVAALVLRALGATASAPTAAEVELLLRTVPERQTAPVPNESTRAPACPAARSHGEDG
ncbi:carbohydrate kinase family protein [Streptomyces sp. NPDC002838]|uniref:carbohydrate kinase family protein n=1 Tax=Streptomyces sp. NPDC002838 TaxID=3154436 RepID=UPI003328E5BE